MDLMLKADFIKELRLQKSWTQEQLAVAAGLSLRTIQRAEKEGFCSLETTQALAAVFEIDPAQLKDDPERKTRLEQNQRGRTYGIIGNTAGVLCAYAGIGYSLAQGSITASDAGIWFGSIGALGGLNCLLISWFSGYYQRRNN